ncbi:MAG: DUF2752 domain-containing protein [Armatimonadota bacterium]
MTTPARFSALLPYWIYLLAFPLGMAWVELRPSDGPTICLFRLLTHLDCPSCGLTRAFGAMGRLDVLEAVGYNPLGPAVFLLAVALWGYALAMIFTGGRYQLPTWWQRRTSMLLTWALAVFLLVGLGRIGYELRHPPPAPTLPVSAGWNWSLFFWR